MNKSQLYEQMHQKLHKIVPEVELRCKAELAHEIIQLKKEKNALILGHNYMEPALLHSIPDFTGDSLELSRIAAEAEQDIIVFCGVKFMAETAKILNPNKKVLIPSNNAGCSLADSITADDVRKLRDKFPGIPIVAYINTYADVKAEIDICCTSGNANAVVESLNSDAVIFLPDEYLAKNVAMDTGKLIIIPEMVNNQLQVPENDGFEMIGWKGRCEVHEKFKVSDINDVRTQFPDVVIVTHPESSPEVVAASDFSGSTSSMIEFVKNNDAPHFLILTECSMGDNIAAEYPDKDLLRLCSVRCPHMNTITLEGTLKALQEEIFEVQVPEEIRVKALRSVQRMIEIG